MVLSSSSKLDGVAYLFVAAGVEVEAYALGNKGMVVLAYPGVVVVHVPLGGVIIIPVLFIESVIDGSVVFCIGVLGQYLAKTYLETKNRPDFIVAETEEDITRDFISPSRDLSSPRELRTRSSRSKTL